MGAEHGPDAAGGGPITLADVAKRAGVSRMTASRALSEARRGALRPETLARVRKAASDLGYAPNLAARSLTARRSGIVAILVPDLGNAVFADIIAGIQDGLAETDVQTIVARTGFSPEPEFEAVRHLAGWNPDAFVLAGPVRAPETAAFLKTRAIRTVEVMDLPADPIDMAVGFPHAEAGALAAEHLHARGHRRPATLASNEADLRARVRLTGFRERAVELGMAPPVPLAEDGEASFAVGKRLCGRLLASGETVDCAFAANDLIGVGAYIHCLEAGLAVPGQLAICGFNDLPISSALFGGLTTVHSPRRAIGLATAGLLADLRRGLPVAAITRLACHVVGRATT